MKKKILFTIYNLELGGTEKAFVNLINNLDFDKYDVDILIQKNEGPLLDRIPKEANVIDFKYKESTNIFKRIRNKLQLDYYKKKMKDKYDCSICFTSWNYNCADIAVCVSENSVLWMHADYLKIFDNDVDKVKELFESQKIEKFKSIVFVSEAALESMKTIYKDLENKMMVCQNYIDDKYILEMSKESIDESKPDKTLFVNVTRLDEEQKSISRILYASKKLKDENHNFEVWIIGDGKDEEQYKKIIEEEEIADVCKLTGARSNPYPYYKMGDCHILCSNSEGYGMANIESLILETPIITTDVAGMKDEIDKKYGIVVDKSIDGVYLGMKEFLENGFKIQNSYPIKEKNQKVIDIFYNIVERK